MRKQPLHQPASAQESKRHISLEGHLALMVVEAMRVPNSFSLGAFATGHGPAAGNGHVRRDIGMPHWLSSFHVPGFKAHGFIERGSEPSESAYGVIHIIPLHQRPDPCGGIVLPTEWIL